MENNKSKSYKKFRSDDKSSSGRKYDKNKKFRSDDKSSSGRKYDKNKKFRSDDKSGLGRKYGKNNGDNKYPKKNERFGAAKKLEFANTRNTILENLNTKPDWVSILNSNPIPKIIKEGKPSEVFCLLKDVYGLTHTHALYRLVESSVFRQKSLHKIASKNNAQKNDSNDLKFYYQLQKVHQLVDLGATDYLNVIKDEIVKLMNFQDNNGRFPMNYHHHAHACNLLIDLGIGGNKLIDKAINWILTRQRDDGGWIHINNLPKGSDHNKASSCIWTTAEIAKLLTKRSIFKGSDNLLKAKSFLEKNYLNNNKSTLLSKSDSWECLVVNHTSEHMFAGGTLKILEIFLNSTSTDIKLIDKMIEWLKNQQMEDSFFPKIVNKHPITDISVTNRALHVMKKYYVLKEV